MNFLADNVKNRQAYENVLNRLFLHAEFISALKTEPKYMGFEKYAKNIAK